MQADNEPAFRNDSLRSELASYRGKFTKRGHEYCTEPPIIDPSFKLPPENDPSKNILKCDDVQGLEQGIYIISRYMTPNPFNTPEIRHHLFMQVYQDPNMQQDIDRARAHVDELKISWKKLDSFDLSRSTEKQLLHEELFEAKQALETLTQRANRAIMIEVLIATEDKQGVIILIASVDHGPTIKPDLNLPYTVVSPILTKSDVEKFNGAKWVDPDPRILNESVAKVRRTPYGLLDENCKVAVLNWVNTSLDAIPGLTSEMREIAQKNMDKPINANVPLGQILGNTIARRAASVCGWIFKILTGNDELPEGPNVNDFERRIPKYIR